MRTAVIGGGIAGLAAAFELEKARAGDAAVEYTLFETGPPRWRIFGFGAGRWHRA